MQFADPCGGEGKKKGKREAISLRPAYEKKNFSQKQKGGGAFEKETDDLRTLVHRRREEKKGRKVQWEEREKRVPVS